MNYIKEIQSKYNWNSNHLIWLLLLLSYFVIFFLQKPQFYLEVDLGLWLGLIFAPYIFRNISSTKDYRAAFPALLFFIFLLFCKSNTLYFFGFGFTLLFLLGSSFGKFNNLPFLLLIATSGMFRVVANIWTFPIRLKMTELTGKTMAFIGLPVEVVGNTIFYQEQAFSVAPACMGLDTLATAFILALMVMAFFERKHQYTTSLLSAACWVGVALFLAIFSNFIRLGGLVLFKIPPETFAHDVMGIVSLVVYMLVPFFFLMKWKIQFEYQTLNKESRYSKKPYINDITSKINLKNKTILLHLILLFLTWQTGKQFSQPLKFQQDLSFEKIEMSDYDKTIDQRGILKLENDSLLIYIKPPSHIFQGTHDPRYCWSGSGYELSNISKRTVGNEIIYTAILSDKVDKLFTAWWLDNGQQKTISEFGWRFNTVQQKEGFRLVNVTSHDEQILKNALPNLLSFPFFQKDHLSLNEK